MERCSAGVFPAGGPDRDGLDAQVAESSSSRSLSTTWVYNPHCLESKKLCGAGKINL